MVDLETLLDTIDNIGLEVLEDLEKVGTQHLDALAARPRIARNVGYMEGIIEGMYWRLKEKEE